MLELDPNDRFLAKVAAILNLIMIKGLAPPDSMKYAMSKDAYKFEWYSTTGSNRISMSPLRILKVHLKEPYLDPSTAEYYMNAWTFSKHTLILNQKYLVRDTIRHIEHFQLHPLKRTIAR
jgi:hypothetical protein